MRERHGCGVVGGTALPDFAAIPDTFDGKLAAIEQLGREIERLQEEDRRHRHEKSLARAGGELSASG